MNHPSELKWNEGDIPPVESVPYNCAILAWFVVDVTQEQYDQHKLAAVGGYCDHPKKNGSLNRVAMCFPWNDELNPRLRWCDSYGSPIGYREKVAYWAWLNRGGA